MKQELILETEVKKLFRKASEILRTTKIQQHYGGFSDGKGKYCAIGAVYAEYGWDPNDYWSDSYWRIEDFNIIGGQLGFSDGIHEYSTYEGSDVIRMNDMNKATFSEIADYLESKGL